MMAVGRRLAVANAGLCDVQEPSFGMVLQTPDQYDRAVRPAAIRHFHIDGPVGVEAVDPGSPADRAGVRADDTVLGVNALRFAPAADAEASTAALIRASDAIAHLPVDRPAALVVRRDGIDRTLSIEPEPACRTRFEVTLGPDFTARADGAMVQVGSRFFADYPDLVAVPVAHELAHNILHHRERLEARGVHYGLLEGFGANVAYFRQTELEADSLSVALLANAGYDPAMAVRFWRLFGPAHAGGLLRSRSHPGWQERITVIERAIAALPTERPARPALLAARDRPLDGDWQALEGRR